MRYRLGAASIPGLKGGHDERYLVGLTQKRLGSYVRLVPIGLLELLPIKDEI